MCAWSRGRNQLCLTKRPTVYKELRDASGFKGSYFEKGGSTFKTKIVFFVTAEGSKASTLTDISNVNMNVTLI